MGLKFYELHDDWRKILQKALIETGLMCGDYTGKIEFNINQGGIVDAYKEQRLTKHNIEKNKTWPVATNTK